MLVSNIVFYQYFLMHFLFEQILQLWLQTSLLSLLGQTLTLQNTCLLQVLVFSYEEVPCTGTYLQKSYWWISGEENSAKYRTKGTICCAACWTIYPKVSHMYYFVRLSWDSGNWQGTTDLGQERFLIN